MEEFRRRQRELPDLVVRPWWTTWPTDEERGMLGFVVEYCPGGVESAELAVRAGRVRAEGPTGLLEARLGLERGWFMDGRDHRCPETLANWLLRLADAVMDGEGEAA